jgi:hypothetical protein
LPLATPVAMKPNAKSRIAIVRREISAATRNQAMPQVYTHSPGVVSQSPCLLTRRRPKHRASDVGCSLILSIGKGSHCISELDARRNG